jgi:hypothetical protein
MRIVAGYNTSQTLYRAYHGFHRAVVHHRIPNNPLSVLLPDFVPHLASTLSANLLRRCSAWQPCSGVEKS